MNKELPDKELISLCINKKDKDAWENFVRKYSKIIWSFIRRTFHSYTFTYSPEDVEDLYHSIVLSLIDNDMRKLRQFNANYTCSVSTWLTTITIHKTIDFMRKDRTHLFMETVLEDREIWDVIPDGSIGADAYTENRQRSAMLKHAVSALPVKDRTIFELLYARGFSAEDAAETLNMSAASIYTRKHRIIEKIRKHIREM